MHRKTLWWIRLGVALIALALDLRAAAQPVAEQASAFPRPPHQIDPDAPLYPDYLALALSHTTLGDDPEWRPLHLRMAGHRASPALIVLPVQTQAYGFAPQFRALLGARLDQELRRRHIDASSQTDIVDWRGPFVRRSDEATIAAFGAEHPDATLLTLYIGNDADAHAFLGLARTYAGKVRLAHRRVDLPGAALDALETFGAALPSMLAELGFGDAKAAAALPSADASGCTQADWNLSDLAPTATPRDTACHALLMGTLMPDFLSRLTGYSGPGMPDRQAWLARAWVEASALSSTMPAMKSVATLAALQLTLDTRLLTSAGLVDDADPVVRPLARMLWARERARTTPSRSRTETTDDYVARTVADLPPFAAAVAREHAHYTESFRSVDLCGMELAVSHLKTPAGCEHEAASASLATAPPSQGQSQLLEEWRLAAAWCAVDVEGRTRGSASGLADVLRELPPRIARHPLLREIRFSVHDRDVNAMEADTHLALVRSRVQDYAQVIATLQRWDALLAEHDLGEVVTLGGERADLPIALAQDGANRAWAITQQDSYGLGGGRSVVQPDEPALWLVDGDYVKADANYRARALFSHGPTPAQPTMPERPNVGIAANRFAGYVLPPKQDELEKALAADPSDMNARTGLALLMLERGASVAEARRLIDARPSHAQTEDALREAEEWAEPGHMFYFAGELQAARAYYARAARLGTGSASDMIARARIGLIDGNLHGALEWSRRRAERYDDEYAAADEAGYLFMLRQPAQAWSLILPRLQVSTDVPLWRAALVGHRMAGDPLDVLPAWIERNRLSGTIDDRHQPFPPLWLRHYAILDRLPRIPPDAAPGAETEAEWWNRQRSIGLRVVKAAIDGSPADATHPLDADLALVAGSDRQLLWPLYAWASRLATRGADPSLAELRDATLDSGFQETLATAMVFAADGKRDEALRFLTASRYDLGRTGTAFAFLDQFRSAPYEFVLASWLMTRHTGERAYARQGLAVAKAYQVVAAYMGWAYAAQALLDSDPAARKVAACRAQLLDPGSMFLHMSGLHPDAKSAVCRKATAW